jgi:predicted ATP-grasp superfamily ATP-dependent carboligase
VGSGAIVTDADSRISLSVIKSLERRNIQTAVTAETQLALSCFSRYCKLRIQCPSPSRDVDGFIKTIQNVAKTGRFRTIFPTSDSSLMPISEHREKLVPFIKLPIPSHESLKQTFDKSLTLKAAVEQGIPTPETHVPNSMAELRETAGRVTYPAVIKPRWSWVWKQGRANYSRPYYVNSPSELVSCYERVHETFPFPLIQEYIPGYNIQVAVLFDNAEPRAACCIREHRMWPVTGGNSVLRETVTLEPFPMRYSFSLLKALQWHGVAEVEFRVDSRDGLPKLMEVNGRFWASTDLARESGIDFPHLLYKLANGDRVPSSFSYKKGVKLRWFGGDLNNLLNSMKGGPGLVNVARSSRARDILSFLKLYEKDLHYDSFSLDDPLPFFITGATLSILEKLRRLLATLSGDSLPEATPRSPHS